MKNPTTVVNVLRNFTSFTDANLETKADHILLSLTDNPDFPTPEPPLTDLQTAITDYSNALANAGRNAPKANVLLKDQRRTELEMVLINLADYVDATAKGNEVMLAGSGFDLPKKRTPVGVLPKPENLKIAPGPNKGTLNISVKAVKLASFYEIMFAEAGMNGSTVWQMRTSSKRQLVIDNLSSGKEYRIKVAAAGSNPTRVWSDEITSFVL